jgi:hypothetical protein
LHVLYISLLDMKSFVLMQLVRTQVFCFRLFLADEFLFVSRLSLQDLQQSAKVITGASFQQSTSQVELQPF